VLRVDVGVLPVKNLGRAKQRLGPAFDAAERASVARALFDDALALCERVEQLWWWVVSDDDEVLDRATRAGFGVVQDSGEGLNAALARAVDVVTGKGASSVTIVPVDVPLATEAEMTDLLDTGATSDAVIVPSMRDGGTNGLLLRPPDAIEPSFGRGSFAAHVRSAQQRSLRCSILRSPGLGLDIDRIEDVEAFLDHPHASRTTTGRVLAALRPRSHLRED
jgi:2-phospho-L-lactate/phosphoenolpyruvate guanylyltransferase